MVHKEGVTTLMTNNYTHNPLFITTSPASRSSAKRSLQRDEALVLTLDEVQLLHAHSYKWKIDQVNIVIQGKVAVPEFDLCVCYNICSTLAVNITRLH
jgi:hypothetical protein